MPNEHEVVVVTGGTAGVGRATVREFARNGAYVAILARGKDGLDATKREVEQLGCKALAISVDVADAKAVEAAAEQVERELGPIDIWVNNAMTSVFSPVDQMEPEEYERVTAVTYLGAVYGTLAALKRMKPRDKGSIVLVGSALAYRGIPLQSAYCGAKHAMQGFADSLRSELLHENSKINLTMVQLPGVNTPQFDWVKSRMPGKPKPIGDVYQPEVIAKAIYWAAHHERRELIVGLPTVKAIFGNKIAPQYGDWVLARDGYEGQQREEPDDPNRPYNLWEPVAGDHGAHGAFDEVAKDTSPQLWATTHRRTLTAIGLGLAGLAGAAWLAGKRAKSKEEMSVPDGEPISI